MRETWMHAHSLCRSASLKTNSISDIWVTSHMQAIALHASLSSRRYQTFCILTRSLTWARSPKTRAAIGEVWQESITFANKSKTPHFPFPFLWLCKCLHKRWDTLCTLLCPWTVTYLGNPRKTVAGLYKFEAAYNVPAHSFLEVRAELLARLWEICFALSSLQREAPVPKLVSWKSKFKKLVAVAAKWRTI